MSIFTGLLLEDLVSTCNCSVEKLPHIFTVVLQSLFGILPDSVLNTAVKASSTYKSAMMRAMTFFRQNGRTLWLDSTQPQAVKQACLSMDVVKQREERVSGQAVRSAVSGWCYQDACTQH